MSSPLQYQQTRRSLNHQSPVLQHPQLLLIHWFTTGAPINASSPFVPKQNKRPNIHAWHPNTLTQKDEKRSQVWARHWPTWDFKNTTEREPFLHQYAFPIRPFQEVKPPSLCRSPKNSQKAWRRGILINKQQHCRPQRRLCHHHPKRKSPTPKMMTDNQE